MDVLIKEIVKRVVELPHDFNNENKSPLTLLSESGYFECYKKINESEIIELLQISPYLITEWLDFSEGNRSSKKWYFRQGDNGKYLVKHWPPGAEFEEVNTTDEFYACALFIKRYVESIRILFNK